MKEEKNVVLSFSEDSQKELHEIKLKLLQNSDGKNKKNTLGLFRRLALVQMQLKLMKETVMMLVKYHYLFFKSKKTIFQNK